MEKLKVGSNRTDKRNRFGKKTRISVNIAFAIILPIVSMFACSTTKNSSNYRTIQNTEQKETLYEVLEVLDKIPEELKKTIKNGEESEMIYFKKIDRLDVFVNSLITKLREKYHVLSQNFNRSSGTVIYSIESNLEVYKITINNGPINTDPIDKENNIGTFIIEVISL